jgi:hypothetical protein
MALVTSLMGMSWSIAILAMLQCVGIRRAVFSPARANPWPSQSRQSVPPSGTRRHILKGHALGFEPSFKLSRLPALLQRTPL